MIEEFRDHLHTIIELSRELQNLTDNEDQLTLLETIEDNAQYLMENGLRWLEEIAGDYDSAVAAVDTMSTEFRTPLTAIRGYAKVIILSDITVEERALLEEIRDRADEMWAWVSDA
jgi:signal transduction histidine kinase